MPNELRTLSDLLDRGLLGTTAVAKAVDPVLLAESGQPVKGSALVSAVKDFAATLDRERLGKLGDRLEVVNSPRAIATAMIAEKYRQLGGAGGVLGGTSGAVTACTDGIGWYRHFQHGSIFWHPLAGVHEVHGHIRDRWAALGWERSRLGYPTSDEQVGKDPAGAGRLNHFLFGSLYWHPSTPRLPGEVSGRATVTGAPARARRRVAKVSEAAAATPVNVGVLAATTSRAGARLRVPVRPDRPEVGPVVVGPVEPPRQSVFEVRGAIRTRYLALGGEASVLGYPITDETAAADRAGRFNHFQTGSIYWMAGTGAHEVHGLIREMWARAGYERDPALGYPLTDELIPDRRVGSRRPDPWRKPVLDLPVDVVKLPATAITGRVQPSMVNLPNRLDLTRIDAATRTGLVEAGIVTHVGGIIGSVVTGPATAPAAVASPNRFGDFEHGVAFWERGATTAQRLHPWRSDGKPGPTMRLAEVVENLSTTLRSRLSSPGVQSISHAGVTGYTHDGVGTHNRQHRLSVALKGGGLITVDVVTRYDPIARRITAAITSWRAVSGVGADLSRELHQRLDPGLWSPWTLLDLHSLLGTEPVAVLSVKTLANGDVAVYVEPRGLRPVGPVVDGIREAITDIELVLPKPPVPVRKPVVRRPLNP